MTQETQKPLRIISLEAANIKRLRAVHVTPQGKTVIVGGRNGQGKSSTLDSIEYALAGKGSICERPLRDGTSKGHVVVDLGELEVTRRFTASGGTSLVVTAKGEQIKSPQAILDQLLGSSGIGFDPLAFVREDRRTQLETLMQLVGLDFSEDDALRARLYNERTIIGRDSARLEGALKTAPFHDGVPDKELSVDELLTAQQKERQKTRVKATAQSSLDAKRQALAMTESKIASLKDEIADLQSKLKAAEERAKTESDAVRALDREFAELPDGNEDEIAIQIREASSTNEKVRANIHRKALEEEAKLKAKDYDDLTGKIADIDKKKADTLAAAKFPLPELSFDDSGVLLNKIPFNQCSSAEQLKASVAIGLAMNPRLRVILIRDGSLLDADSLQLISDLADTHDAQIWIERVGEGSECSVVIEDGTVKETNDTD